MNCSLCNRNPARIRCLECRNWLCETCAEMYLVGNGCSPTPVYLCPSCLKDYAEAVDY
ncbi:MAG: hypothetical protein H5T98_02120 [Syntrophomonadaceae bacterium]|nr:hypothetical protein [Syntrophomonadaceae bacterium]